MNCLPSQPGCLLPAHILQAPMRLASSQGTHTEICCTETHPERLHCCTGVGFTGIPANPNNDSHTNQDCSSTAAVLLLGCLLACWLLCGLQLLLVVRSSPEAPCASAHNRASSCHIFWCLQDCNLQHEPLNPLAQSVAKQRLPLSSASPGTWHSLSGLTSRHCLLCC